MSSLSVHAIAQHVIDIIHMHQLTMDDSSHNQAQAQSILTEVADSLEASLRISELRRQDEARWQAQNLAIIQEAGGFRSPQIGLLVVRLMHEHEARILNDHGLALIAEAYQNSEPMPDMRD